MSDIWMLFGFLLGCGLLMLAMMSAQSAHEDKLDRRAMWGGIMDELAREREAAYSMCRTAEEKNRFYLEWDEKSRELRAEIIARHRKLWGISE